MDFNQNSITTTITHNERYGIDRIQSGNTIVDRQYTHDFNGNITYVKPSENESLPFMPDLVTRTDEYAYVTQSDLISTVTEGSTEYDYTYDANGNITSDDRHTYVYNEQNQLFRVLNGQTVLGEYTYNGKGQRVKKIASSTTIYHYDLMGNLIQETDGSGNVIASYIYAGINRIAKVEPNGTVYYYHNDHLGTPLAMTDTSGNIVWKAAYNPFGKAEVDQSSTVTNNFRFPGQYYDAESGLHYNWHRYYDPGTGRYMTADPLGNTPMEKMIFAATRIKPLFQNLDKSEKYFMEYGYIENNPINKMDLEGLAVIIVKPGIINGNIIPGYNDQDNECSWPAGTLNPNSCLRKCCLSHDDCYKKYGCNLTSWIGNILGLPLPCQKCNSTLSKDRVT